jgi:hypothetical protein
MITRRYRRPFRLLAASALAVGLQSHIAAAGAQRPIIGAWCGVEDYVIQVEPDSVTFHARRGFYSPPAIDVKVGDDHAEYSQHYDALEVTVTCKLSLQDPQRAIENCDNPQDSFYPKAGETAELHRCAPKPELGV